MSKRSEHALVRKEYPYSQLTFGKVVGIGKMQIKTRRQHQYSHKNR